VTLLFEAFAVRVVEIENKLLVRLNVALEVLRTLPFRLKSNSVFAVVPLIVVFPAGPDGP
jgi:hypothetical protein